MLHLFQTYGLSGAMYGCQVWGTHFIGSKNSEKSDLHSRHVCFLKRLLGVKRSTPNAVVLRECGQLPLHFYWFRTLVRFWNDLVRVKHSENALLHSIVSGDLNLLRSNKQSWCKDLHDVLTGTQGCEGQAALMSSRKAMNVEVCKAKYMEAMYEPWTACVGSPRDPRAKHRKLLTYHTWFGVDMSESVNKGVRPPLPRYLVVCENPNVVRSMARFRTSSHYLRVETGRFSGVRYPQRVCEHCGMGVEDEWHAASAAP